MFSALTANNITPLQYQYPTLTPLRWPTTGIVRIWNITYHMKTYHSPTSLKAELFSLSWLLPSLLRVGQLDWLMDLVFAVVTIVTDRNKLGHFIITDLRTKLEWSWVLDGCYVVSDQVKLSGWWRISGHRYLHFYCVRFCQMTKCCCRATILASYYMYQM